MDWNQITAFTGPLLRSLEPASLLWHYTDTQGLEGIVRNRTIRLSHPSFLNDPSELQQANSVYNEMLNRFKSFPDPLTQRFVSGYLDYERDTNSPFMIPFMPPFVASFCENRDQLELWRQYGDDGRGFSLGFRVRELQDVVARQDLGGIYVYKILYDRNEQCDCTAKILDFFLKEFQRIHGTEGNNVSIYYASLRTVLIFFTPFFKHPCYSNEQENRLVLPGSHTSHHETKFLARRGYFKPYIDLEIGTNEAFPLDTVVIGPATSSPRCEKSLRMFLDYHGLKSTKIEYSHLPYLGNDKGSS